MDAHLPASAAAAHDDHGWPDMSVALQDEDHHHDEHHPEPPHLDAAQLALLQHHHDEHEAFHEHFPHEQDPHTVHDELHHEQQQLQAQDLPHEQQPYHSHQQQPQQQFHDQQQEQHHLQQQEPPQEQQQQQGVVQHVVLTPEQLAQLTGALGSSGGDLAALSGSLGSNELLQRLMSPAVQAGPEAADHEQHSSQAHMQLQHAPQPGDGSYMDVLPSSSGVDAQATAPEPGMLQQGEPAGAAVAGVAEAPQQQKAAMADAGDAAMMPQEVQQGVKRKAGE